MKKRLLITSIVMMLVVAVALSTATYAWFTSNNEVTASKITLKAEVSGDTALGIGWLGGNAGPSITSNLTGTLNPIAPVTLDGSTYSQVLFGTSTIKESDSYQVFNGLTLSYDLINDAEAKAVDGTHYYNVVNGVYEEVTDLTAGTSSVNGYYTKNANAQPIVFNNGEVQAFYVKNLSKTNAIGSVTVSATFATADSDSYYQETTDTNFQINKTYYSRSGSEGNYTYTPITVVASDPGENQVVAGNPASGYYDAFSANDLVRIAIFTKAQSAGTAAVGNYTLLGVLGKTETEYTQASVFNKNTTYYTRSGASEPYTYTQANVANAEAFAAGTYYTAENTAAYGTIATNGKVKDLSHYEVSESLTLVTNLGTEKEVDIVAVIWLDGTGLTDARASEMAEVSLSFQAA